MITRLLALALVVLAACGNDDGSDKSAIVRLGVGIHVADDGSERSFMIRDDGSGWTAVDDPLVDERNLSRVLFASHDVAWAYGGRLLRSRDAGLTWEDAELKLPDDVRNSDYVLDTLAFADARTGYLGINTVRPDGSPIAGPFVLVTHDGGESWSRVEASARSQEVGFVIGVRSGVAEILRHAITGSGIVVQTIDGAPPDVQTVALSFGLIRDGFAHVGERGWIVFAQVVDDITATRPAILTSARPGAPWIAQSIPDLRTTDFGSLDMCDAEVGVAGGSQFDGGIVAVVLYTADGGNEWQRAAMPGARKGFDLSRLLCVGRDEIYVSTTDYFASATELFRSTDGGRSFERVRFPHDDEFLLYGLASNARFP